MTGNANSDESNRLAHEIGRQFADDTTTRYLRSLPLFQAEAGLPDRFVALLGELERSERTGDRHAGD